MNGEFKKYISESELKNISFTQDDVETKARQLKYLFKDDPNFGSVIAPEEMQGTIVINFKEPLVNKDTRRKEEYFQIFLYFNYNQDIMMSFNIKPRDSNYLKYFREKIPNSQNDINILYSALKNIINDLEHFIIKDNPINIKYISSPLKKSQIEVLSKDPKNIIYINSPDPEFKIKYGHFKDLNKAGIV